MIQKKEEFLRGITAAIPIAIGYIPISIAFGVISSQSGIPLTATVLMSIMVFAGASQFMAVNMLAGAAGGVEIVLAAFVLNLRHLIMSMSLMNLLQSVPKTWKAVLSFGITDETFAVAALKQGDSRSELTCFYAAGLFAVSYGVLGHRIIVRRAIGQSHSRNDRFGDVDCVICHVYRFISARHTRGLENRTDCLYQYAFGDVLSLVLEWRMAHRTGDGSWRACRRIFTGGGVMMEVFYTILGMSIVTYIPRLLPGLVMDRLALPPWANRWLRSIPCAALGALIFPGILTVEKSAPMIGVIGGAVAVALAALRLHMMYVIFGAIATVLLLKMWLI